MIGIGISKKRILGGFDSDATALFARMSSQPSDARKNLINTLIIALKSAGAWASYDVVQVYASHAEADYLLNWKSSSFGGVAVNSPSFLIDNGVTTNGTSNYINSGFTPNVGGTNYSLNDAAFGIWANTAGGLSGIDFGSFNTGTVDFVQHYIRSAADNSFSDINNNSVAAAPFTETDANSYHKVHRTASNAFEVFRNAVSKATSTDASTALNSRALYVGCRNNAGTAGNFCAREYRLITIGKASGVDVSAEYNAWQTYFTAIGL